MPRRRIALVTGAGTRVGRAIAVDLSRHGWQVVAHFHTHRPPRTLLGIRGDLAMPDGPVAGPGLPFSGSVFRPGSRNALMNDTSDKNDDEPLSTSKKPP